MSLRCKQHKLSPANQVEKDSNEGRQGNFKNLWEELENHASSCLEHGYVYTHTHTYIYIHTQIHIYMDFPGAKKNPIAKARNSQRGGFDPWVGEIPRSRRSPGGGHGNPLQCSCLENPIDRGAWQAIVHGVAKSQAWLSNYHSLPLIRQELHSLTRPNYSSSLGCKARVGEWNRNVEKITLWKLRTRDLKTAPPGIQVGDPTGSTLGILLCPRSTHATAVSSRWHLHLCLQGATFPTSSWFWHYLSKQISGYVKQATDP